MIRTSSSSLGLQARPLRCRRKQADPPPVADASVAPPGFASTEVMFGERHVRHVHGGRGETVVRLHGWPQTRAESRDRRCSPTTWTRLT